MTHTALRRIADAVLVTAFLAAGTLTPVAATADTTRPYFSSMTISYQVGSPTYGISWDAADDESGVKWVNARFKVKPDGGCWSKWRYPDRWQHRDAYDSIHKFMRHHRSYRFAIRAVDNAGNRTAWTGAGGGGRV